MRSARQMNIPSRALHKLWAAYESLCHKGADFFLYCFVSFETHAGGSEYCGLVADRNFPGKRRPLELKNDGTHREESHHPQES